MAASVALAITIWAAIVYLVVDRWRQLVQATGGSTHDCHLAGNDCGVLGEFAEAHPLILLSLILAAAAIPAAAIIWTFGHLLRSSDEPESHAAVGPPARS